MTAVGAVQVRPAVPGDAAALGHCHLACWREAYRGMVDGEALQEELADEPARVERWRQILSGAHGTSVALAAGELVGFVSAGPQRDADLDLELELYALYVRQVRWGTGLGRRLLEEALGGRAASLWVLAANDRARRFYAAAGFAGDGTQKWEDRFRAQQVRMVRRTEPPSTTGS